jgi:hypothetical protein
MIKRPWPLTKLFAHRSIWINVPTPPNKDDSDGGRNESNPAEAYVIAQNILQASLEHPKASIAAISFYKAQLNLIKRTLNKLADENGVQPPRNIEHLTVDSCQGREADMVFVSFTIAGGSRFVRDPNRLNVALTRARTIELQARAEYVRSLADFDRATATDTVYVELFKDPLAVLEKKALHKGRAPSAADLFKQ